MGMAGEGRRETAHQRGIGRPDFRAFAQPFSVGHAMQRQPPAAFAEDIAMRPHPRLKIIPAGGLTDIRRDARPDGRKKPFLGPARPLHGAGFSGKAFPKPVAYFFRHAAFIPAGRLGQGGQKRFGQIKHQAACRGHDIKDAATG